MHSKIEMTTEERLAILNKFGGKVRTSLIEDCHPALPSSRAQYVISTGTTKYTTTEFIDARMTGWGINDDLAIGCLYKNIRTMLWNMVMLVE